MGFRGRSQSLSLCGKSNSQSRKLSPVNAISIAQVLLCTARMVSTPCSGLARVSPAYATGTPRYPHTFQPRTLFSVPSSQHLLSDIILTCFTHFDV